MWGVGEYHVSWRGLRTLFLGTHTWKKVSKERYGPPFLIVLPKVGHELKLPGVQSVSIP